MMAKPSKQSQLTDGKINNANAHNELFCLILLNTILKQSSLSYTQQMICTNIVGSLGRARCVHYLQRRHKYSRAKQLPSTVTSGYSNIVSI